MPTEPQKKANGENAKRSTGPRSSEGKAKSGRNVLKHGQTGIRKLSKDPGFRLLLTQFHQEWEPTTPIQMRLVGSLSTIAMRIFRDVSFEFPSFNWVKSCRYDSKAQSELAPNVLKEGSLTFDIQQLFAKGGPGKLGKHGLHLLAEFDHVVEQLLASKAAPLSGAKV
jgi:hypothetical protein